MSLTRYWASSIVSLAILPLLWGQSLKNFEQEVIEIIKQARPAVVSIEIVHKQQENCRVNSGVILDQKGHIVTVASNLKDSKQILVRLESREQYEARIIGIDQQTNLAILKIDATNLTPARQGSSDDLLAGSFLIVVGNPYGLTKSVSYGIVSGLERAVWLEGCGTPLTGLIQTTAPVNPGDAGGLVADSQGRFVGMACSTLSRHVILHGNQGPILEKIENTLRRHIQISNLSETELKKLAEIMLENLSGSSYHSQSINFILPSTTIYWVAEQIILKNEVTRGWIGIDVKDVEQGNGVVVTKVVPISPAAKYGLQVDDLLLSLDGQTIPNSLSLLHRISHALQGQKVLFTIKRRQETCEIELELGRLKK